MKTMNVLITGGAGFIGTWLANELKESGYELFGVDMRAPYNPSIWKRFVTSSCDTIDYLSLIKEEELVAVFHLAGGASVGISEIDPYSDFNNLLPGTAKLALYIAKYQPNAQIFYYSSAAVYGEPTDLPIKETANINPMSPYGIHKYIGEVLLKEYAELYNLQVSILRVFSVFGPGLKKQLIWDVTQKIIIAQKNMQGFITLMGNGFESRDFIYVEDLSKISVSLLKEDKKQYDIYNIASGSETSIKDVVKLIMKSLNINLEIRYESGQIKGNPKNWRADVTKIVKKPYFQITPFENAINRTTAWISEIEYMP